MIPIPMNLPDLKIRVPTERSCNCCDYVVCTVHSYCCGKKIIPNGSKKNASEIKTDNAVRWFMDEKEPMK